ncbi:MAG: succinyl-diaminopimelate desuccinylase, partial [Arenicella sp.]
FQISNIAGGTGATNVIPETVKITFNLRYSTEITAEGIQTTVTQKLEEMGVKYSAKWTIFGLPFLTEKGALVHACQKSISDNLGINSELSTTGGTSDGRFIAPTGAQVVELGPINATIHKVNECVDLETPEKLSKVYQGIMQNLLL